MKLRTIGVVGAGQMGSGIAQICAEAGLAVVLSDIDDAAVERGVTNIQANLLRLVQGGKVGTLDVAAILERISTSVALSGLSECDLIIEAATEQVHIKQDILRQLDMVVEPRTIIATNTSSVSVTKLASTLRDPSRFVGLHFFNPVPVMKLVEIVRGVETSIGSYQAVLAFAETIGKTAISVKNSPGFLVNRILAPMVNEAIFALHEGISSAEEIDTGMKSRSTIARVG